MSRQIPWFFLIPLLALSCGSDPLNVDVSSVKVPPVKILRFDHDFFKIDTNNIPASLNHLREVYGGFTDGYLNNVICFAAHDSLNCDIALRDFLLSYDYRKVEAECDKVFTGDFSAEENELTDAMKHFRYYFPNDSLPRHIYASMNGFAFNFIHVNNDYAVGLEFYLGEKSEYYEALQWPAYKRYHYRRPYLVADFVQAWMSTRFPYNPVRNDVVSNMIYQGKLMYMAKALLRNTPDTILTGYSKVQLDWCVKNEAKMWATLIEQKKVFSDAEDDINHFTSDGPFTPGFPHESPGRAGAWIGMRIIETFMKNNPKVTLPQMMDMQDGQAFLNRSKYKPKF